ncbi:MAG: hypothetical protein ACFFEA_03150 [Candidatus Thorarchaeota archaeon]
MIENKNDNSVSIYFSLSRYFLHGIFFSVTMSGFIPFAFLVDWIVGYNPRPLTFEPLLVLFTIVYIFLGLFIVIGAINSSIAEQLWSIRMPQGWQGFLGQGVVLFIILCFIQLPVALLTSLLAWTQPSLFLNFGLALPVVLTLSVVITSIPNGIVCRRLALALVGVEQGDKVQA